MALDEKGPGWGKNSSIFFCSLFYIFRFPFLWSPSSCEKRGTCVIGVLNSCTAVFVLSCYGSWPWHCERSCVFSGHNPLNTFSPNELNLTKKELTTECVWDNMVGSLGPEKWMVLPEDHMTRYFENGQRKSIL